MVGHRRRYVGQPTASDPLGQRPAPVDTFQFALQNMVRHAVEDVMRGKTGERFDGTPDQVLAMELIARGWVAYKPREDLRK